MGNVPHSDRLHASTCEARFLPKSQYMGTCLAVHSLVLLFFA